jgi:hypothetical protein
MQRRSTSICTSIAGATTLSGLMTPATEAARAGRAGRDPPYPAMGPDPSHPR